MLGLFHVGYLFSYYNDSRKACMIYVSFCIEIRKIRVKIFYKECFLYFSQRKHNVYLPEISQSSCRDYFVIIFIFNIDNIPEDIQNAKLEFYNGNRKDARLSRFIQDLYNE